VCLQLQNPCDIHLNICAILSQMNKHELALQHAMKALILIQDELITKMGDVEPTTTASLTAHDPMVEGSNRDASRKPEDRMIVLCIAYHNIAVE